MSEINMLLALLLTLLGTVLGFNLEPRLALLKEGPPGSYFGFSVAQHSIHHRDTGQEEPVALVGAPLGDRGRGALYKCPLDSARAGDCRMVDAMPGKESIRRRHLRDAQGQWLGGVVHSQGPGKAYS